MNRSIAYSTVTVLCALWVTGCSTANPFDTGATKASVAAAKSDKANAATDPAATPPSPPASLEDEIKDAQALRAKGDYDGAVKELAQLILISPDDSRVIGEYGKVLTQQGRAQEALPFLKRAVELKPNDWTFYSAMGVDYDQIDDRTNARLAYQHALSLQPGEPSVLNNFAVSRMLAGDYAGAKKLLAQAEAQGAANPKIAANLAVVTGGQSAATGNASVSLAATAPASSIVATSSTTMAHGAPVNPTIAARPAPLTNGKSPNNERASVTVAAAPTASDNATPGTKPIAHIAAASPTIVASPAPAIGAKSTANAAGTVAVTTLPLPAQSLPPVAAAAHVAVTKTTKSDMPVASVATAMPAPKEAAPSDAPTALHVASSATPGTAMQVAAVHPPKVLMPVDSSAATTSASGHALSTMSASASSKQNLTPIAPKKIETVAAASSKAAVKVATHSVVMEHAPADSHDGMVASKATAPRKVAVAASHKLPQQAQKANSIPVLRTASDLN